MKAGFDKIKNLLEDPFFEMQHVGREAVGRHIRPLNSYGVAPDCFRFAEWTENEVIRYGFADTLIGRVLLADTSKGICFLGFACGDDAGALADMRGRFPGQRFEERTTAFQELAAGFCNGERWREIPLHLKGTPFQLDIWRKLVRIPEGSLTTYGSLTDDPKAAQAVGGAVGANPVSYIVPCHRVVRSDGSFHGYYWGPEIKKQLLAYELQQ